MLIDSLISPTDGHVETPRATRSSFDNKQYNDLSIATKTEYNNTSPFYNTSIATKDNVIGSGKLDTRSVSKTTNESCGW